MTTTLPKSDELAQEFIRIIREWLTPEEVNCVVWANLMEPDSRICHTHDYCDANEAMLQACAKFGLDCDTVINDEAVRVLWNEAWELANKQRFKSK